MGEHSIPKVPALRGKTIAWVFYEDSTRTAQLRDSSQATVGRHDELQREQFLGQQGRVPGDTIETITAMGIDGVVVRHRAAGAHQLAVDRCFGDQRRRRLASTSTQALLDLYSATRHLGELDGKHVAIVGDINHSRVARSNAIGFAAMGAGHPRWPATLLPPSLAGWPVETTHDLDSSSMISTSATCFACSSSVKGKRRFRHCVNTTRNSD